MKKSLKIGIVVGSVIVVMVGLSLLERSLKKSADDTDGPLKTYYDNLSDVVNSRWSSQTQWNESLYDSLANVVSETYKANNIRLKQKEALLMLNNTLALAVIDGFFNSEMKSPDSRRALVDRNFKGIEKIRGFKLGEKKEPFLKDTKVRELSEMYRSYDQTLSFAGRSFRVTPTVSPDVTWTPFTQYRQSYDSQKNALGRSKYFQSHFSKIKFVKTAWESYGDKVNRAEAEYYESILKQVKEHLGIVYSNVYDAKKNLEETCYSPAATAYEEYCESQYKTLEQAQAVKKSLSHARTELGNFRDGLLKSRFNVVTQSQGCFLEETENVAGSFDKDYFNTLIVNLQSLQKSVWTLTDKVNQMDLVVDEFIRNISENER